VAAGALVWSSTPASTCRASAQRCLRVDLQADLGSRPGPRPQAPPARADDVPRAASGARPTRTGSPAIDVPFGWIEEISRQLSERSCATASTVAGSLSEDVLARLVLSDTLADATRLLEAAPRLPPVTAEPANRMFEPPKPDDVTSAETWARLVVVNRRLRPAGPERLRSLDRHRASNGRDPGNPEPVSLTVDIAAAG
jgi:hypothetical protein